jgi:large subunit ribosomal protein L10
VLTRAQKQEQVAELSEKFGRASCVYLVDYRGVDVQAVNRLRARIHAEGHGAFEYRVAKNTLLKLAAEGSGVAALSRHFTGPTAIAISFGDPVGLARILTDFAKDHEVFQLKAGVLEGRPIEPGEIATLATLPSLAALRGRLVGLLQAPAIRLARLLQAPGEQLARVLEARSRQHGGGEGGA